MADLLTYIFIGSIAGIIMGTVGVGGGAIIIFTWLYIAHSPQKIAPGTILSLCSDGFLEVCQKADIVISKGQGNFEGLSETKRSIFFLLLAKYPVIARDIGCQAGDVILFNHQGSGELKEDEKIMEAYN